MLTNREDIDRVIGNHRRALAATEVFLEKTPEQLQALSQDSVQVVVGILGSSSFDPSDASLSLPNLADLRDPTLLREIGVWSQQLTNERAAATPLNNAFWELRVVGGEVAPEFFLAESFAEGLGKLRASPRFVGLQIAMQSIRSADSLLLSRLGTQTDSVLTLVRRNMRDGSE